MMRLLTDRDIFVLSEQEGVYKKFIGICHQAENWSMGTQN